MIWPAAAPRCLGVLHAGTGGATGGDAARPKPSCPRHAATSAATAPAVCSTPTTWASSGTARAFGASGCRPRRSITGAGEGGRQQELPCWAADTFLEGIVQSTPASPRRQHPHPAGRTWGRCGKHRRRARVRRSHPQSTARRRMTATRGALTAARAPPAAAARRWLRARQGRPCRAAAVAAAVQL